MLFSNMSSRHFLSFYEECGLLLSHFVDCCNNSADHVELIPVLVLYVVQRFTNATVNTIIILINELFIALIRIALRSKQYNVKCGLWNLSKFIW